jgi:excisionase family DNA binding protein
MGNEMDIEKWVSIRDVADHLCVSRSYVSKAVQKGEVPFHRVGRNLRFRLTEIDAWIEGNESVPA